LRHTAFLTPKYIPACTQSLRLSQKSSRQTHGSQELRSPSVDVAVMLEPTLPFCPQICRLPNWECRSSTPIDLGILGMFKHLCRVNRFQRKWRPAEHWTALIHLYYDIPEPLKFNGNDLNDELRRDKAMEMDIKQNHKLPNLHMVLSTIPRPVQIRQEKNPLLHTGFSALSISARWTWLPLYPLWLPWLSISWIKWCNTIQPIELLHKETWSIDSSLTRLGVVCNRYKFTNRPRHKIFVTRLMYGIIKLFWEQQTHCTQDDYRDSKSQNSPRSSNTCRQKHF
jgi:hypothetical protein